jgi:glycosyltransferase 2 family protein
MGLARKYIPRLTIALLIGLALLFVWSRFVDFKEIRNYILHMNVPLAFIALLFYFFSFFIRSYRMKLILAPVVKLKASSTFNIFMAGNMINILVPVRLGELSKCYFIKKLKKVRMSKTLPSIFIDKIMDLISVVLLLFLIPVLSINLSRELTFVIMFVMAIFGAAVFVLFLSLKYETFVIKMTLKFFFWLPKKFRKRFNEIITFFVRGMSVIKQKPARLLLMLGMTIGIVISDATYIFLTYLSFGQSLPFLVALFGYTLFNLSFILPTPPGQIGSNEVILLFIFSTMFGIERNLVSAVTLYMHFFVGTLTVIIGMLSFYFLRIKSSEIFRLE